MRQGEQLMMPALGGPTERELAGLYSSAHNIMRNVDGLHPQEAFDELLKALFVKQASEEEGSDKLLAAETRREAPGRGANLAALLRGLLTAYVGAANSWVGHLWQDAAFHLSDGALEMVWRLLEEVKLNDVGFDVRSAAVRQFLSEETRRGLGIYLTPDPVVKMMVEFADPGSGQVVYDPACGTGSFLIECARRLIADKERDGRAVEVYGSDKNPRMLAVADLNLGHIAGVEFRRRQLDALFPEDPAQEGWPREGMAEVVLTNPPFGVQLDGSAFDLRGFVTCVGRDGRLMSRQASEVVFIEQCIRYLKPGGVLAIVVPRSIITNSTFATERAALGRIGWVVGAAYLPPETFSMAGTQASTAVLFIRKYGGGEDPDEAAGIAFAEVENVGYDSTGRTRDGSGLVGLGRDLRHCADSGVSHGSCVILPDVPRRETFSVLGRLTSGLMANRSRLQLNDVVSFIGTGKTPPRQSYRSEGLFLLKVGNLTGNGIDWTPRERNFVYGDEAKRREQSEKLMLRAGDILFTSSAHSRKYIGEKVDIVGEVPDEVGGRASYVGELMMVRVRAEVVDPYLVLALLRHEETKRYLRSVVRGQTAHLYRGDIVELPVPDDVLSGEGGWREAAELLKREMTANSELRRIALEEARVWRGLRVSAR